MGFFDKIKAGLTKTREALSDTLGSVFSGFSEIDDDFYDELTELLVLGDVGVKTAEKICGELKKRVKEKGLTEPAQAQEELDGGWTQVSFSEESAGPALEEMATTETEAGPDSSPAADADPDVAL